jgi:TolB-like protein/Tfp pilus assembly protein PilF
LSSDPDSEYFSDGITFDIINHLSKITDLKVISRTSIMRYKATEVPLRRIGEELGVSTIVEGEVQRVGNRVRINAQLVDALTDVQLWAEQYDRQLVDVFAIQSDVARRVAAALKARLTSGERRRIERRATRDLDAYNLYLKGRDFWDRRGAGIKKGLDYFQRALQIDPDYALAHAGVADCYTLLGHFGELPPRDAFPKAKAAALRAVEIDDGLAEAHSSLGFVKFYFDWDPQSAEQEFQRALDLNPGYAPAHYFYATLLLMQRRAEAAIAQSRLALDFDPLSVLAHAHVGWMLVGARRYERAREQLEATIELDPDFPLAHWVLGWAYGYESRFDEAIPCFQRAVEFSGRLPWFLASFGWACGVSGQAVEARAVLSELSSRRRFEYVRSLCLALVHMGLDERDAVLDWLDEACQEHDTWVPALRIDPVFDGLRSEPRFIALMRAIGMD